MSGKREKKHQKGAMSRKIVYYCIFVLTAAAVWAVVMKTRYHEIDLSDILTFTGAAFGGELLLLAFKRVYAKPNEQEENEYE